LSGCERTQGPTINVNASSIGCTRLKYCDGKEEFNDVFT